MTAKKLMMLVLTIALIMAVPAVLFANSGVDGEAEAQPPTEIEAKFEFEITGPDELTITGKAEGLSPGKKYHSAVYGFGSSVEGVNACKPAASVGGTSMFAGNWSDVNPAGKATLLHVTDADLDKIFTISVRRGLGGPAGGPGSSKVVLVCGEVEVEDND